MAQFAHVSVASMHTCAGHGVPMPPQAPPVQESVKVQKRPSLHIVPFGRGVKTVQFPSAPPVWHEAVLHGLSNGVQSDVMPPVHTPPWQFSPTRQAIPSSQSVPFATGVNVSQFPSAPDVLHDAVLHWSLDGVQFCAAPPMHTPPWQASPTLHAKLSSQSVPFGRGVTVAQFPSAPNVLHDAILH